MHASRVARRTAGVYYTPSSVVKYIVRQALGPLLANVKDGQRQMLTVVDPACGAGAFLVEAYRALLHDRFIYPDRRRVLLEQIFGVELDGQAAHETRLALASVALPAGEGEMTTAERGYELDALLAALETNIRQGDALLGPDIRRARSRAPAPGRRARPVDWQSAFPRVFEAGGFDAVLMNPPYVNIRQLSKTYDGATKEYLAATYRCARGAYDLYVLFVEQALTILRPGGVCGMITPNKLAVLDYAAPCRELLLRETRLRQIADVSSLKVFPEAGVYPYIMVWEKRPPEPEHLVRVLTARSTDDLVSERPLLCLPQTELTARGGFALSGSLDVESRVNTAPLAERAMLHSGATGFSASQLAGQLVEHDELAEGTTGYEFIVSGNIDRYEIEPGQVRFMKRAFARPILPDNTASLSKNKRRLYARPKIVIAGMTKRLEAALDPGGLALGVQVYAVADWQDDPRYLLALLNSKLISYLFRTRFSAKQLSGGFLAINKGQLAQLPIRLVDENSSADVELRDAIIRQVDALLNLHAQRRDEHRPGERARLAALANLADRHIDELVYRLYRMTGAEIELVERQFATPASPRAQVA